MHPSHPLTRRKAIVHGAASAAALVSTGAWAQEFPTKTITVTVGSAAGGFDSLVRMMTDSLAARLGQSVVVLNRPGANGLIAVDGVRRAEPDGHTLLFATVSTMVMNPMVYKNATYHAVNDFEPVGHHAFMPMVWIANKDAGLRNLQDVVAFARKHPGKLNLGNHGAGGMAAVFETLFAKQHGIDVVLVPHNGAPQSIMRLIAGDVQVGLETLSTVLPRIRSGDVVPLAVTSGKRIPTLPDVQSWTEAGMPPEYGTNAWYGFFAPKGTPPAVVAKLNDAINKTLQEPRIRQNMEGVGGVFDFLSAEQFSAYVAQDVRRFTGMMSAAGISPK